MVTLSIPLSVRQNDFLASFVKDGRAKNKAIAVKQMIDSLEEEAAIQAVLEAEQEMREGKGLRGDLDELAKLYA